MFSLVDLEEEYMESLFLCSTKCIMLKYRLQFYFAYQVPSKNQRVLYTV